jgi:hypothetical protein
VLVYTNLICIGIRPIDKLCLVLIINVLGLIYLVITPLILLFSVIVFRAL